MKYINPVMTALVLLLALASSVSAQITVNDVVLHMPAGQRPIKNIVVRNNADDVFYVTASASLLDHTEPGKMKEIPTDQLLVSPKAFSVPGKGERTVRVVLKSIPKEKEEVFQVTFTPNDKGFDEAARLKKNLGGRQINIRVLTGMAVLVFADPIKPLPKLLWERKDGKVTFSNQGNQHVRLMFGKACRGNSSDDEKCENLPSKRVYPGEIFEVSAPSDAVVNYTRRDGASGDYQPVIIEPGDGSGVATPTPDSDDEGDATPSPSPSQTIAATAQPQPEAQSKVTPVDGIDAEID